ncbi:MAG: electron transport complex subunit RsxG [Gammaproteobacteria bacterium]|nr:electron transport complex subunit RsxG [Gammaproteobacteria bacterium]
MNNSSVKNALIAGLALAVFGLVASALVGYTFENTKERIAENEKQALLNGLHEIIPADRIDNDLYNDFITVQAASLGYRGQLATIYRARQKETPVAAILNVVAPDGYSGAIKILVGVNFDGTIAGVRVIDHKETPGLGDYIEADKSDWILSFNGRSLRDPLPSEWKVKKDGGEFDQVTGATITPRAVVTAVRKALEYYDRYVYQIFAAPSEQRKQA